MYANPDPWALLNSKCRMRKSRSLAFSLYHRTDLSRSLIDTQSVLDFRVSEAPGEHAQGLDGEDELVVRVGNHAVKKASVKTIREGT